MTDAAPNEVLDRARAGDHQAFETLVDSVAVRLFLFIKRSGGRALGPDCDVDDLYQLAVVRAWTLLPRFVETGPDSFYRWLVSLARSAIATRVDYLRAKGRGSVRHAESFFEVGADGAAFATATAVSSLAARREDTRTLDRALGALDAESRRLIERTILDGVSLADVAAELGLKKSTVFDRLARAIADLQRLAPGIGVGVRR